MPKVKKQRIDLSILFYNCIFTISNTQKNKSNLKKQLKKIGVNVYEKFIMKKQKNYKYFFIQSYNCVDDNRLYYAKKHNYQVICPEFIQYCIINSIICKKENYIRFSIEYKSLIINDINKVFSLDKENLHFFKKIPNTVREDDEIPQTLFEFLGMPEREKYDNNNNITLIVPLFLKHIKHNYLILLKDLLNIFFFEKFKILINDNINYNLKCKFIDKKKQNIIKIILNKYEYEIDVLNSNRINVMQLIDTFYDWKKDHNNIYSIVCVTDLDIYEEGNENNLIFGRATGDKICVISLYHHETNNLKVY